MIFFYISPSWYFHVFRVPLKFNHETQLIEIQAKVTKQIKKLSHALGLIRRWNFIEVIKVSLDTFFFFIEKKIIVFQ